MNRSKNLFLRCVSAIYLSAFCSFYLQIRGLYGPNGILPSHSRLSFQDKRTFSEKFWENPTLLHLAPMSGLPLSYCMELCALLGIFLSFLGLVKKKISNSLAFIMLWLLYLSLYQVGQTFMHFQWDILLLECGFISILVAPFFSSRKYSPKDHFCYWLVKWLLFRLMFASGVVKLTSECPTWWGLSALPLHFESQCIPTPLAWYFYNLLPIWFHKLSVVATFIIEILLPFLFFIPVRKLQLISCYGQILLQLLIILTGNYNFFNFLTTILCISLMDDYHLYGTTKVRKSSKIENLLTLAFIMLLAYVLRAWFGLEFKEGHVYSELRFGFKELEEALKIAVPVSIIIGAISFVVQVFISLYDLIFKSKSSFTKYLLDVIQYLFYLIMACLLFGISLVPFSSLDHTTQAALPPFLKDWHGRLHHFHLTSLCYIMIVSPVAILHFPAFLKGSYGLFRSMTGVGGRPELVLEGASELHGPWMEIPFKYKPGSVERPCSFIVPYQPRLDWQMWFAALGNYHQNPWLISLAYRLLTNQTDVVQLLDSNIYNEFEGDWPPKYIKGSLYKYHYTTKSSRIKGNWWERTRVSDYLPIFSAEHQPLIDYLIKQRILNQTDLPLKNTTLAAILDQIWALCTVMEPHIFIWGLFLSALTIIKMP